MVNSSSNFNGYYQAIIDYAKSQAYVLPTEAQQIVQNDVVNNLVAQGIWDDLDVFYVFANNGSSDFGRINWINPGTFNAVETSTGLQTILPTWASNQGYTGTQLGFSYGFLRTFYNALTGTNFSQTDGSMFVYTYNNLALPNGKDVGFKDNLVDFRPDWGSINTLNGVGNATYSLISTSPLPFSSSVGSSIGFSHVARISNSQIQFFKNGTLLNTANSNLATVDVVTLELYFLSGGASGSGGHSKRTVSVGGAGASISTKASEFSSIITNYMNSL